LGKAENVIFAKVVEGEFKNSILMVKIGKSWFDSAFYINGKKLHNVRKMVLTIEGGKPTDLMFELILEASK